jgi:hypothetical protein
LKRGRRQVFAKPCHVWPEFLPDGKHYLYLSLGIAPDQKGIYAASLDSNERKFLVATDANAAYLLSGQLLFTHDSTLMAQPFDLRNLTLGGEPRSVADRIQRDTAYGTHVPIAVFAASPSGVLVWRRGAASNAISSLPGARRVRREGAECADRRGGELAIAP